MQKVSKALFQTPTLFPNGLGTLDKIVAKNGIGLEWYADGLLVSFKEHKQLVPAANIKLLELANEAISKGTDPAA